MKEIKEGLPFQGCTGGIDDSPAIVIEDGRVVHARYGISCFTVNCPVMDAEMSGEAAIDMEFDPKSPDFQLGEALSDGVNKLIRSCLIRNKKKPSSIFIEISQE